MIGVFRSDFEDAGFCSRQTRSASEFEPVVPLLAVKNKFRSINILAGPGSGVITLTVGIFFAGPFVAPAEIVPVIHMKSNGHELAPKTVFSLQPAQPRLGGRATAATFGSVKFHQRHLALGTLKLNGRGVSRNTAKHSKKHIAHENHTLIPIPLAFVACCLARKRTEGVFSRRRAQPLPRLLPASCRLWRP